MTLHNRTAIVTGANQGLGFAIAEAYLEAGLSGLAICARDKAKLNEAADALRAKTKPGQRVFAMTCDVAKTEQVDALVAATLQEFGRLDVLVNNAGVYGPLGPIESIDWKEWADAIAINLTGLVYVCRAVVPAMKAAGYGKIVNLSGGGATNPLPRISAYAASKAGVVRFTETLALELQDHKIDVNAVAPGALDTRLTDQLLAAGPEAVGEAFYQRMKSMQEGGKMTPLNKGAALCVWLASGDSDGLTGKLISAPWDPWPGFEGHRDALENSDVYTLRRVMPKDRGQDWGG
ncbi:(S)-1-phenylethanol dehydrogenase Ped [Rhodospirillaceae bacterium LM-1]|nr:(S)-1-phenylethanol dehydrogenase Ped [Rhodospirillaceae bacterium LM-1]